MPKKESEVKCALTVQIRMTPKAGDQDVATLVVMIPLTSTERAILESDDQDKELYRLMAKRFAATYEHFFPDYHFTGTPSWARLPKKSRK